MINLADVVLAAGAQYSAKPMLYYKDIERTHAEIEASIRRLANGLRRMNVTNGSRVVLLAHNSPEWLVTFFAILATGATVVPLNPGLAPREVQGIVEHCHPDLAIVQAELLPLLEGVSDRVPQCVLGDGHDSPWHQLLASSDPTGEIAQMQSNDIAIIFYTSGTTGKPKGVMLSHGAMLFDTEMFSRHLRMTPSDVTLVVGSMAFMLHLVLNAISCIRSGATVVLLDRFHPEKALRSVEQYHVTLLMGVPTVYVMMINWMNQGGRADLSSIRWAFSSGASFPAALYERAKATLGITVFDLWGMTECAPVTSYDPTRDSEGRHDSCGRALPNCEVRVVDADCRDMPPGEVGEVLLRSPAIMSGYFDNAKATEETIVNGFIRSGDLGTLDEHGFLFIVGRQKDMIIRGGSNVYPAEIEDVLYLSSAVAECAVIGVPDETFGETVNAFVVLREGREFSQDDLIKHCRVHLAEYKVPARVLCVDALPKGPTGKILRRELRERAA